MAVYNNRSQEKAERLVKLRDYLYANASSTHAVKIAEILEYLKSERYEVEIKTVYSDLHTLRDFLGLDIEYIGQKRGYILKNPPFEPYELRSIVNSIQAAQFITQQEADSLTQKVMNLADKYTRPSLNRQTYIPNRVRTVNEEAMKGLDIIYEAIAQDKKIGFKYFEYTLPGQSKPKKYRKLDNSAIITASPYGVAWIHNKFWIYAIVKIPKTVWFKLGLKYDSDYGEYVDDNGEIIYDIDEIDFEWEEMDGSGQYVYEIERIDLELMEKIEISDEKREGKAIAQKWLDASSSIPSETTKLRVDKKYVSDTIAKFGNEVFMSPDGNTSFIATIHEEATPELYMWTQKFSPPIEIIYPENAEADLKAYFLSLAKGEAPDSYFHSLMKGSFPYDDIH